MCEVWGVRCEVWGVRWLYFVMLRFLEILWSRWGCSPACAGPGESQSDVGRFLTRSISQPAATMMFTIQPVLLALLLPLLSPARASPLPQQGNHHHPHSLSSCLSQGWSRHNLSFSSNRHPSKTSLLDFRILGSWTVFLVFLVLRTLIFRILRRSSWRIFLGRTKSNL